MPRVKVMTLQLSGNWEDWPARRERLLLFLQNEEIDVLLLQQIEERPWRLNQAEEIAYLTGYGISFAASRHVPLFPSVANGIAIVSRFPMSNLLTREVTPAAIPFINTTARRISHRVELALDGLTVIVYNTHFPASPERRLQAAERLWSQVAQEEAVLVIVAGSFGAAPQEQTIGFLQGHGPRHSGIPCNLTDAWRTAGIGPPETYPSHDPRERVDYIFYQAEPSVTVQEARVFGRHPMEMSDHAAVVATFAISPTTERDFPLEDEPVASLEPTGGGRRSL